MNKYIAAVCGALAVVGMVGCGSPASTAERPVVTATATEQATPSAAPPASVKPAVKRTVAQREAIEAAQSYLETFPMSRSGLIQQLTSKAGDGFKKADATYAVDQLKVNWNDQAVKSAQSYLDMGGYSKESLTQQLTSPSGEAFTKAQAMYAVAKVGL